MGIVTYLTVLLCTTMRHEQNMALVEAVKFQTFHKLYETIPFEEVPLDVTLVRFINTSLRDITFFPPFDSLSELVLQRQPHIKIFPNFENISSSLTILEITDCSLTHIDPSRLQILVNLEKLDLSTNRLTTPFPDMDRTRGCAINILRLYNNLLHSFPYLPVIGQTLQTLVIKGNFNITMVSKETLSVYTKLETLNNNPGGFRKFPDLQLLAAVHQAPRLNIDLQNNVITSIDANDISPVVAKNWTVHLMSNPIKHVGNMLHIGSGRPPIALYGTPVPCDCGLRWLKAAGDRKTAILAGSVQCDGSGSLGGNLQDLHYDDLVCDGKLRFCISIATSI